MKSLLVAVVVLVVASVHSEEKIKVYKRLIPADVLRDHPGTCYATTQCANLKPGQTWPLTPFCGRSTCVHSEADPIKLLELVEDCGPLPLETGKCVVDTAKTNKTADFPHCCPVYKCEGKLEFPEIPLESAPSKKV